MNREINLISAVTCTHEKGKKFIVPESISNKMKSKSVIAYYIESKDQINLLGLDEDQQGYDSKKSKVFNLLIQLSKDDMKAVMQLLGETFSAVKTGQFKVLWQTGVCDVKTKTYEGCIWQGLVVSPKEQTKETIEDSIMKANLKLGFKTFRGVDAEEVVVTNVG